MSVNSLTLTPFKSLLLGIIYFLTIENTSVPSKVIHLNILFMIMYISYAQWSFHILPSKSGVTDSVNLDALT